MRYAWIGLVLVLACGVTPAAAQGREVGVKLGPTFATVRFDQDSAGGYDTRVALAGGGFAVLPLSGRLAVQLEGLLSPKGGRLPDGEEDVEVTLVLDYFELPVMARVTIARSPSRSFHVFAGPSVALRTNAKYEVKSTAGDFANGYSDDIRDEVKRVEFGVNAGAGMNAGRHVVVDARYYWGLTDVNRDTSDGAYRNRTLTVFAGYRF